MNIIDQLPFITALPPELRPLAVQLVLVLVALIVVWVLRRVIRWVIFNPIKRTLERSESPLAGVIYDALQRPSQLIVFSIGIYVTLALFNFGDGLEFFATSVARAILLMAAFVALYGVVDVVFVNVATVEDMLGLTIETRLLPFLRTITKVIVVVIGGLIVLQEFRVDVTALVASFGVVGLALSLAAQDTAANVFSFAAILSDNPFKVGDYIQTKDFEGNVEEVGVRSTRIRQLNQSLVIVPNSQLTDDAVVNWSRLTKRRVDLTFKVENDTSSVHMRQLLERVRAMLLQRALVEASSVIVRFVGFGEETLDVRVMCYVRVRDYNAWTAEIEAVNLSILEILEDLNIFLALPDRVVMMVNDGEKIATDQPPMRRMRITSEIQAVRVDKREEESVLSPDEEDFSSNDIGN